MRKPTKRMPVAMQASATSMMGMPTMPKRMETWRAWRVWAINWAPVAPGARVDIAGDAMVVVVGGVVVVVVIVVRRGRPLGGGEVETKCLSD